MPDVPADAARLTGINNAITYLQPGQATASVPGPGELLTVEQAIRLALARDPRIQASLAKVRVAEAEANQVRLLPNPILVIDLRFPVSHGSNTAFEPSLTADLLSLLQKPATIAAADHRLRASAATALITVLDVMSEVQQAYASARSIDVEIDNAERRGQRLAKLRDLAQKRLEAGEATRLDVLTLDSQVMQSTLDLSDLRIQRVQERLTLARLLGEARSNATWRLAQWEPPPETMLTAEGAWIDAAIRHRPEITSRVWELRALGEDLSAISFPPLQGGEMGVHAERDPDWRVGPTMTVPLPIFDFGQAARAKVRAQRIAARHDLAEQQLEVIQDVRLAYAGYIHARRALADTQGSLLPLQRAQTDQAQLAYTAGEADLTTLLLAENQLELTLAKVVELEEKVTVARLKLQRAAGGAGIADAIESAGATRPSEGVALPPISAVPTTEPASVPTSQPATGPTP
jgi:outer membrane protein TolC